MQIFLLGLVGCILSIAFHLYVQGLHFVSEGSIGIYWFGGKLLDTYSTPGYHSMIPFLTNFKPVQISMKTTRVSDVPCGTSGGVELTFDKIEVVHRLRTSDAIQTVREYSIDYEKTWIIDRIFQETNQLCSIFSLHEIYISKFDQMDETLKDMLEKVNSKYVPGLELISVRLSKPALPSLILQKFEEIEKQASKLKVVHEHQNLVVRTAETERSKQVMAAEKKKGVSEIECQQALARMEREVEINLIQDEIFKARDQEQADSEYYRTLKLAESNSYLLTPQYLQMMRALMMTANTEYHIGNSIPNAIFGDSAEDTLRFTEYV